MTGFHETTEKKHVFLFEEHSLKDNINTSTYMGTK